MWKIKQIFDGDYGCEETQNENPKVSVTLINENNSEGKSEGKLIYEKNGQIY